ncbi:hypothetical protein ACGC1H_000051 [Rhizoctonia solani]
MGVQLLIILMIQSKTLQGLQYKKPGARSRSYTFTWYAPVSFGMSSLHNLAIIQGMRDVNSADPRVEAAVQQVVQLGSTIEPGSGLELHTLIPCVIAGAAARQEKHRASLRTKIASGPSRYGVTLVLRTSEFAAVLDHLWHGAGAEGKPTTWEDYVQSRCALLPIVC